MGKICFQSATRGAIMRPPRAESDASVNRARGLAARNESVRPTRRTPRPVIPEHLAVFLRAAITSVWALDLLILMRNAPGQAWTVTALNDRLRASTSLVEEILSTFVRRGLVVANADKTYRYRPADSATDALVGELAQLYAARPVTVIKEIVTAPNEKIRTFVDAFRLKKD